NTTQALFNQWSTDYNATNPAAKRYRPTGPRCPRAFGAPTRPGPQSVRPPTRPGPRSVGPPTRRGPARGEPGRATKSVLSGRQNCLDVRDDCRVLRLSPRPEPRDDRARRIDQEFLEVP